MSARFFSPVDEHIASASDSVAVLAQSTSPTLPRPYTFPQATVPENSAVREAARPSMAGRGPSPVAHSATHLDRLRQAPRPNSDVNRADSSSPRPAPTIPAAPIAISSPEADGSPIPVPAGTRLPAVLIDLGQTTNQLAGVADQIAAAYLDRGTATNSSTAPTRSSAKESRPGASEAPAWDAAREAADERYRAIFGQEAYVRNSAEAARQALGSK